MRAKILSFLTLLALAFSVLAPSAAARASSFERAQAEPAAPDLLQFTAGGHVIGFQRQAVYVAAADHALRIEFVGGAGAMPQGSRGAAGDEVTGGTPALGSVTYAEAWTGVSVQYDAVADGIVKSTYTVAPGVDLAHIQLRYNLPVQAQADGSLKFELASALGALTESAPVAWQEIGGARLPVPVKFTVSADNQVGFQVGDYNARYPLTIDPTYQWHSFLGSGSADFAYAIALDASGSIYIAGTSPASWEGDGGVAPKRSFSGGADMVVVKLSNAGLYQWHAFYGSSGADAAYGITVDTGGSIYVTGYAMETWGAPLHVHSGGSDIAVLKLDSTTAAIQWNTFYGSGGGDFATAIEVDATGYLAVTGYSDATWQGGGPWPDPLNPFSGGSDIAVLQLRASDGLYLWHTFYGSSGNDYGFGIAVDASPSNNIYVIGSSNATWGSPLRPYNGGIDVVILKLNKVGDFQWNTFYGSPGSDQGMGIAVDGSYNVYAAGYSDGTWQGEANADPQHAHAGGMDIAVLKLNTSGIYQWHTFYGSSSYETANGIAVDGGGNVYVAGGSGASWQGDGNANPAHPFSGLFDLTLLRLTTSGEYSRHTFYGSSDMDLGGSIDLDAGGGVYLAGTSAATWLGDASTAPRHAHTGYYDFAVIKLGASYTYQWHTFYGSASDDSAGGMAVDAAGNIYIAGMSRALWLGNAGQFPIHAYSSNSDIVVVKLDRNGVYQWHTFYGSSDSDSSQAIALDANGNIYVTGDSYTTWQGDGNTDPLHPHNDMDELFVLKLDASGAYQWHTFYGGIYNDQGNGLALDLSGNVYVMGESGETYQGDGNQDPRHAYTGGWDYAILKLDANGAYQWHTFYGSATHDYAHGMALDSSGNVYVVGDSFAGWQGDNTADPLHGFAGGSDIAVLKLDQDGVYQWHTFYGSSDSDHVGGIAMDTSANLYIAGSSTATWQGDGDASPLHPFSGGSDMLVLKLNSGGAYQWHTFYGSGGIDRATGIAADGSGNLYVTGGADYTWQGDGGADPLHPYAGGLDVMVAKLTSSGGYRWHTFYGSTAYDQGADVALDGAGNIYLIGASDGTWQAEAGVNPLRPYADGQDMFVMRLTDLWPLYLPIVVK